MNVGAALAAWMSAVLAGCGLFLMLTPRARPEARSRVRVSTMPHPASLATGLGAATALILGVWMEGVRLALALIVLAVGLASADLWQRSRRRQQRARVRASVVELSEALVGELRAGRPVIEALDRSARVWIPFAPAAAAARLGADVPATLSRLGRCPGGEGLVRLASAWRVAQHSGCSLAGVLDQVAVSGRAELASERLVQAELASARATARLVALLPVVTLAMASGAGGDPWQFLLSQPSGLTCLASGAGLVFIGLWWIDRIADGVARQ
ncbi:hypothetical protein BH18ACT9_BH18ACT9_13430 [soil metagenome]